MADTEYVISTNTTSSDRRLHTDEDCSMLPEESTTRPARAYELSEREICSWCEDGPQGNTSGSADFSAFMALKRAAKERAEAEDA